MRDEGGLVIVAVVVVVSAEEAEDVVKKGFPCAPPTCENVAPAGVKVFIAVNVVEGSLSCG